ncbi:hypothetical protein MBANPS3_009232 [Mucor bainieri]
MQLYNKHYPPHAPYGNTGAAWDALIQELNQAYIGEVPMGIDACKKKVNKVVDDYAPTFSEEAMTGNTGSGRRSTPLEQVAYEIWVKREEDKKKDAKSKRETKENYDRKVKCQADLRRRLILNDNRHSQKRLKVSGGSSTSREKGKHVMVDVTPEEVSSQIKDETDVQPSPQETLYTLDNSFYTGEGSIDDDLRSETSFSGEGTDADMN